MPVTKAAAPLWTEHKVRTVRRRLVCGRDRYSLVCQLLMSHDACLTHPLSSIPWAACTVHDACTYLLPTAAQREEAQPVLPTSSRAESSQKRQPADRLRHAMVH